MAFKRKVRSSSVTAPAPRFSERKVLKGSNQQVAIWDALVKGDKHMVVQALAGTGKTTTCEEGLYRLQEAGKLRNTSMVAFNSSIAAELKQRVPANAEAGTFHAYGLKSVRAAWGNVEVDSKGDKVYSHFFNSVADELTSNNKLKYAYFMACKSIVSLVKNLLLPLDITAKDIIQLAIEYGCLSDDEKVTDELTVKGVKKLLKLTYEDKDTIDFDDMVWFPAVYDLPMRRFDTLFVDESQDLNACQHALVKKMGERIVVVGDKYQAIYGFRGACADSMQTLETYLKKDGGVDVFPLTMTRRCPKKHVELAQQIVPDFACFDDAVDGVVNEDVFLDSMLQKVQAGDLVMCRTNAPVCTVATRLLKMRKKVRIPGTDLKKSILSLFDKIQANSLDEFRFGLSGWFGREFDRCRGEASRERLVEERYACVVAFCDGADSVAQAKQNVENVFAYKESEQDITCSSVHRAKGLEAENTWVLIPEQLPAPWAKTKNDKQQEMNLKYVALTRSKHTMNFVPDWRTED